MSSTTKQKGRQLSPKKKNKMKLRIRSVETKETTRIEIADSSSLIDLKTLIATKISSSSSPVSPQSVTLSLNRIDELISTSPADSLKSLGLASGDLLFYSETLTPKTPNLDIGNGSNSSLKEIGRETVISVPDSSSISGPVEGMDVKVGKEAPLVEKSPAETLTLVSDSEIPKSINMEVDNPSAVKYPSVPYFLKRVIHLEKEGIKGNLGFLVVAVHAVFLESGFVVCNGDGSRLPKDWNLATSTISIQYTLPELLGQIEGRVVKLANLKFSTMSKHILVYGSFSGELNIYRLNLDLSKVLPLLVFLGNVVSSEEEEEVFKFWKTIKDGLCLPLLIDICHKNGLPPPPCFARLPTELKFNIFELLTGVDIAKIGCTSSEMRYITLNDELWKQKFREEFRMVNDREIAALGSWKQKFKCLWIKRRDADKTRRAMMENRYSYQRVSVPRYPPSFVPQMFPPIIGGYYDIGSFDPMAPGLGFPHQTRRRNFSPRCDLGGHDYNFMG